MRLTERRALISIVTIFGMKARVNWSVLKTPIMVKATCGVSWSSMVYVAKAIIENMIGELIQQKCRAVSLTKTSHRESSSLDRIVSRFVFHLFSRALNLIYRTPLKASLTASSFLSLTSMILLCAAAYLLEKKVLIGMMINMLSSPAPKAF